MFDTAVEVDWENTLSIEAAAPPISSTGDSAIWAFFTAVTVLVRPGPAVTVATPILPDNRATASAANTADACQHIIMMLMHLQWLKLQTRLRMWHPLQISDQLYL